MLYTFTDQLNNEVPIPFPPKRIISLVPSQTELLTSLGLHHEVVGITKFCVHPVTWFESKTIVGGTKNFHFDVIDKLRPDLIIGNKEENYQEGIQELQKKYPVWMSDIVTWNDALSMIHSVGTISGKENEALDIINSINQEFASLKTFSSQSTLYFIWRKPWMAAGRDTFIHAMLEKLNLRNVITSPRYPELRDDEIRQLNPEYIFLSSEPYPFQEKHIAELKAICPSSKIVLVDGEMFSWYGSRLLQAPLYFNSLWDLICH
jgi:ABC-type Fe3+-hydroxamate transport system substrate-binding protein